MGIISKLSPGMVIGSSVIVEATETSFEGSSVGVGATEVSLPHPANIIDTSIARKGLNFIWYTLRDRNKYSYYNSNQNLQLTPILVQVMLAEVQRPLLMSANTKDCIRDQTNQYVTSHVLVLRKTSIFPILAHPMLNHIWCYRIPNQGPRTLIL